MLLHAEQFSICPHNPGVGLGRSQLCTVLSLSCRFQYRMTLHHNMVWMIPRSIRNSKFKGLEKGRVYTKAVLTGSVARSVLVICVSNEVTLRFCVFCYLIAYPRYSYAIWHPKTWSSLRQVIGFRLYFPKLMPKSMVILEDKLNKIWIWTLHFIIENCIWKCCLQDMGRLIDSPMGYGWYLGEGAIKFIK